MLERMHLTNFRGFSEHSLPLSPVTVIVGRNNAGKSTIVEALRLLSIITERYQGLSYNPPPRWVELPKRDCGVSPSLKGIPINYETICHLYSDPPSIIVGHFSNGYSITVYLGGENKIHAVIKDSKGNPIKSKSQAAEIALPSIAILPQVAPVSIEEPVLTREYVLSTWSSSLAAQHFRNQLALLDQKLFEQFRRNCEETWPDLKIVELIKQSGIEKSRLYLEVRDREFVGELSTMGHGLQMWLQTMWFLTWAENASTVILDEPDVYMHADLQRRILKYIRNKFQQVIVTTHSIEIISEAEPSEILVVDRHQPKSRFAGKLPIVQQLVDHVGSAQNVHLMRLWNAKKFLYVEGKDAKILRYVYDLLFPESDLSFETIPNVSLGGWTGWPRAVGASKTLSNALGEAIRCYCILDSDYHTDEEIAERYSEAREFGLNLHIWSRKEIENFLLLPSAISRVIEKSQRKGATVPSPADIAGKIEEISRQLLPDVQDCLASEIHQRNRAKGVRWASSRARTTLEERVARLGGPPCANIPETTPRC